MWAPPSNSARVSLSLIVFSFPPPTTTLQHSPTSHNVVWINGLARED